MTQCLGSTVYDSSGRKVKESDPRNYETLYDYDPAGHVTRIVDAMGGVTEYEYDDVGRITRRAVRLRVDAAAGTIPAGEEEGLWLEA